MTMQFAFNEEQQLIRESARNLFNEHAASVRVRAAMSSDIGYDEELWRLLSSELGWSGIAIPERYGGAGLGMVELGILQQEQGRRLVPSPFFSTVCLAVPLILQCGTESQKARWLGEIAAGKTRVAVAVTGPRAGLGAARIAAGLQAHGRDYRLSGESGFFIYGHACDALLVAAHRPDVRDGYGVSLVIIDPQRAGIAVEKLVMLDLTRPMARIRFSEVHVNRDEVLGEEGAADAGFERALDFARIALAAETVGAAEWTLEMTTQYVKERSQFGRPIGSFQAIKHRLADMMVMVEAAKSAAWYAACAADEREAELTEAASIAKAACCDALYQCAASAIQLHGGIGFTWEHDAHLYFKRARAATTLLGSPSWHRERLAQLIGLGAPASVPAF